MNQNNAAQAAEHVETLQRMRADYNPSDGPMSTMKAAALDAALSKLRAPVAGEAQPSDVEIIATFAAAGINTDTSLNGLYTVRGQSAQLINGARALLAHHAAPRAPSSFVNAAGIKASDKPGTVVHKLDAAFHDAVTFPRAEAERYAAPQASAEDVRNATLEEAAVIVETAPDYLQDSSFNGAARAIRALKQPQAQKEGGRNA